VPFLGGFQHVSFHLLHRCFGISAAAAGTLLLVTRVLDAVVDPIVGMLADRTETRWGKFRPYLLWFCLPYAIIGVLMFTTPDMGTTGKLIWAYVTYCGMMVVYTAINIPYTSLMVSSRRIPLNGRRCPRSSSSSLRRRLDREIQPAPHDRLLRGVQPGARLVNHVHVHWRNCRGLLPHHFFRHQERVHPSAAQKTSVGRDLGDLFTNAPWLVLLAATVTFILFVATRSTITVHYLKYYVGQQTLTLPWASVAKTYSFEDISSVFLPIGDAGSIVGVLLVGWFAGRVGKKPAFLILFAASLGLTLAFYWLKPSQLLG